MTNEEYRKERTDYWRTELMSQDFYRGMPQEALQRLASVQADADVKCKVRRDNQAAYLTILKAHIPTLQYNDEGNLAITLFEDADKQAIIKELSELQQELGSAIAALNNHPST